jgi:shikimate dehydrogenase
VIGVRTKLLGVIGWPVEHSRSPAMHNAALEALGLDYVYLAFAVRPDELGAAIFGGRALGLRGLNVTIPHKEAAMAYCRPDELARAVGAVNTLIWDGAGPPIGTNTDVHGFRMLAAESGSDLHGRAIVLGAGGAARAVVAALRDTAYELIVVSRSGRRIEGAHAVRWPPSLASLLRDCDLLVDATPRGLDEEATPLPLDALPDRAVVLDLVVRRETALTRAARARGLRAETGGEMLLHQGAAALERWVGRPAPVDVMRTALAASLVIS